MGLFDRVKKAVQPSGAAASIEPLDVVDGDVLNKVWFIGGYPGLAVGSKTIAKVVPNHVTIEVQRRPGVSSIESTNPGRVAVELDGCIGFMDDPDGALMAIARKKPTGVELTRIEDGYAGQMYLARFGWKEPEEDRNCSKVWVNVDEKRFDDAFVEQAGERQVLLGADVLEVDGKTIALMHDGRAVCTVGSRMKCYPALKERVGTHVRKVVLERSSGAYGPYWRVGLYY